MYEISSLEPFFTPFPEPGDVFAGNDADIARAAEHLLPLLTIDLEAYDPEFAGLKVHMLSPIEPYEGLVGEKLRGLSQLLFAGKLVWFPAH